MDGTWLLEGERDMVDKVDISRPWTILPLSLSLHPAPDVGGKAFFLLHKQEYPTLLLSPNNYCPAEKIQAEFVLNGLKK